MKVCRGKAINNYLRKKLTMLVCCVLNGFYTCLGLPPSPRSTFIRLCVKLIIGQQAKHWTQIPEVFVFSICAHYVRASSEIPLTRYPVLQSSWRCFCNGCATTAVLPGILYKNQRSFVFLEWCRPSRCSSWCRSCSSATHTLVLVSKFPKKLALCIHYCAYSNSTYFVESRSRIERARFLSEPSYGELLVRIFSAAGGICVAENLRNSRRACSAARLFTPEERSRCMTDCFVFHAHW